MHGRADVIVRVGDRLAAPQLIPSIRAQIGSFHYNGFERAREAGGVGIVVSRHFEAASANVTSSRAATECKLADRGRVAVRDSTA